MFVGLCVGRVWVSTVRACSCYAVGCVFKDSLGFNRVVPVVVVVVALVVVVVVVIVVVVLRTCFFQWTQRSTEVHQMSTEVASL